MRAGDVLGVLDLLDGAGAPAWVAGGWAVDALVARQTRPHADVDLAVDAARLDVALAALRGAGFEPTEVWLPVRIALAAGDGRCVDLHPVRFADDGSGVQEGLHGERFAYPADGFGEGWVGGRAVPCLAAPQQLAFRRGYPPRDVDVLDVARLHRWASGPRLLVAVGDDVGPAAALAERRGGLLLAPGSLAGALLTGAVLPGAEPTPSDDAERALAAATAALAEGALGQGRSVVVALPARWRIVPVGPARRHIARAGEAPSTVAPSGLDAWRLLGRRAGVPVELHVAGAGVDGEARAQWDAVVDLPADSV